MANREWYIRSASVGHGRELRRLGYSIMWVARAGVLSDEQLRRLRDLRQGVEDFAREIGADCCPIATNGRERFPSPNGKLTGQQVAEPSAQTGDRSAPLADRAERKRLRPSTGRGRSSPVLAD